MICVYKRERHSCQISRYLVILGIISTALICGCKGRQTSEFPGIAWFSVAGKLACRQQSCARQGTGNISYQKFCFQGAIFVPGIITYIYIATQQSSLSAEMQFDAVDKLLLQLHHCSALQLHFKYAVQILLIILHLNSPSTSSSFPPTDHARLMVSTFQAILSLDPTAWALDRGLYSSF